MAQHSLIMSMAARINSSAPHSGTASVPITGLCIRLLWTVSHTCCEDVCYADQSRHNIRIHVLLLLFSFLKIKLKKLHWKTWCCHMRDAAGNHSRVFKTMYALSRKCFPFVVEGITHQDSSLKQLKGMWNQHVCEMAASLKETIAASKELLMQWQRKQGAMTVHAHGC